MLILDYLHKDLRSHTDLSADATVYLRKGAGRELKAGGPWLYKNEIGRIEGTFENGDILRIRDFDGYFLGYGFINLNSMIQLRLLSRREDHPVTPAFLAERARACWEYRKKASDPLCCRLVFGEADFLPGLTVDKYNDILVVESLALGMEKLKETILSALLQALAADGYPVRGIYERSDAPVREKEGLSRFKGFLSEAFDPQVEIRENGVRFLIHVDEGQKTGFFLDQKQNRASIRPFARGAEVLDLFTHTGSFALNAALAGASHVTALDASAFAVEQAKTNASLNGMLERMDFVVADAFSWCSDAIAAGRTYDLVILDPPAFTKDRQSVKAAYRGYADINQKGLRLVRDRGYFATCSCSHFMQPEMLMSAIQEAARSAHKRLRQISYSQQAPDHPVLWASESSAYLKFFIFQIVDER